MTAVFDFIRALIGAVAYADADAVWIMLLGALVGVACSLVGCFIVLRRMSMLGDAISHAVLPGIVVAFMLTGSRQVLPMLIGAGAVGILTAFLVDVLNRQGKLQSDASIGVTFTFLFALGVILISRYASMVDLDLDCVLYGEILYAPFDRLVLGDVDFGPRTFWSMGIVALLNLALVVLAWKQLKVCAFDPGLAKSLGISVALWHYALMGAVSMTTVAAFESVGVILVVAMLTVPPNTAYLLTDRLWVMIVLSCGLSAAASVAGYALASALDASIAGAIASVLGLMFVMAALLGPQHGLVGRNLSRRRAARRPAAETAFAQK
jgi:manganese/zinc/iron transport system permease protein